MSNGTQAEFIETLSMAIKAEQPDACAVLPIASSLPAYHKNATYRVCHSIPKPPRQVFIIDLDVAAENTEGVKRDYSNHQ